VKRDPQALREYLRQIGVPITREDKITCPKHDDRTPSCHVYDDQGDENAGGHLHCYGCGYHADAYQYFTTHGGMTQREALERLDGRSSTPRPRVHRTATTHERAEPTRDVRECDSTPLPEHVVAAHDRRAAQLDHVPEVLDGRGFTLDDLRRLRVAGQNGEAILPITGPAGQVLRFKKRNRPGPDDASRYRYTDEHGSGTPAWCSPNLTDAHSALVIEGELNGMAAWCARPDLGVVGVAGTNGTLPLGALADRQVIVYADGDDTGQAALERWARALQKVGCYVAKFEPWDDGDACDIAGRFGRDELARRLTEPPSVLATITNPNPLQTMTRELAEQLARYKDTDLGNGERLAHLYGNVMRFVPGIGAHVYDNGRWRYDDGGMVHRYAQRMLRMLYAAAAMLGEEQSARAADLAKHAARSERGRALDLAIERAWRGQEVADLIVRADKLDPDPDVLNVANGTVHLPSATLRPHNPLDLITKRSEVPYIPNAPAPTWRAFIQRITGGDEALAAYLQRALGYTLTGHTSEQCVFIAYGTGANGKSTLLEICAEAVGDYGAAASFDTFASTRDGKVQRFGIAGLAGARFVRASEGEVNAKLAEGTVKVLTGGEMMRAEYKGRDSFEFRPRFTLWLATNHRPETRGTDHGLWRRLKLVPFTVTIPEEERDRDLATKLRAELPGILAWLIEGARDWYIDGLREPETITNATKRYREDMDTLGDYFAEYVRTDDPNVSEGSARLHAAYTTWCRENRERVETAKAFAAMLTERGYTKRRTKSGAVWDGLKLTKEGDEAADAALTPRWAQDNG
jgi:putative DNA primase/helicase